MLPSTVSNSLKSESKVRIVLLYKLNSQRLDVMQRTAIYRIIIAIVVAAGVGVAFAAMSMNGNTATNMVSTNSNDNVRVINHAMGTTEITGIPQRILAIGPEFTEHLLTLGVQPAAIIDSATLRLWYPNIDEQLSPDVVDLGDYPPNIEAIAQLKPDLILGEVGLYGEFYEDLSDIAPTVLYELFPDKGGQTQLERMEEIHIAIADIVGRHDRGVANIENLHAKFEEAASKLQTAGLAGHRFIYLEAGVWEDAPWMFVYAENAELSLILEEIGLENAIGNGVEFDRRGFIDTSLEGLAAMDGTDVHMFYTTALGGDVFQDSKYWAKNPVWTNLKFVKAGQVHNLDKVYAFAGPSQAELLVDKVVEALTQGS
jgi:ABC-type Fe3+-hydroxamate transport system substrate-binding protein